MTLDEMIAFLDGMRPAFPGGKLAALDDKFTTIIAALRAGQEIEAVLKHALAKELLLDGTAKRSARDWARHALQAWDTAVSQGAEKISAPPHADGGDK